MKIKMVKGILILLAALLVIQIVRVQMADEAEVPEPEGLSRIRTEEIERRDVVRTYRYTGKMRGIKQVMLFPSVPGVVKEKPVSLGSSIEKDAPVILVDRYEEGVEYKYSRVRSPVSGRVMEIIPDIGERVSPQQPVASVADTSVMRITLHIPHQEAMLVREGQGVSLRVKALGEEKFTGSVYEIEPALDRKTMKRKVEIRVDNERDRLRPYMVCEVGIAVDEIDGAKAVPLISVVEREGEKGVFIIGEENYARWYPVEVLLLGDEYAAVEGDFQEGNRVAYDGHYGLVSGRPVEVLK